MRKKILIGILTIIVLASIIIGYFYFKKQQLPDFDMHRIIPEDVAFIIESHNFIEKTEEIRGENKVWAELTELPAIRKFDQQLEYILNIYMQNNVFKKLLENNHIIISAHKIGKTDIGFLSLIKLHNFRDKKFLLEAVKGLLIQKENISTRKYNNIDIYKIITTNSEIYFSFHKGIFIISPYSILLEDALRQSEVESSLLDDRGFMKVKNTAGQHVDANVFLNLSNLNSLVSGMLNDKQKNAVSSLSRLGDWAELDVNLKNDAVLLNGFSFSSDTLNNYFNIFKEQEPVDCEIQRMLPSNTSIFLTFGISNIENYLTSYTNFLHNAGKITDYQKQLAYYKNKYAINLEQFFKDFLDEEVGIAITDEPNNSALDNTFTIMRIKSKSIVESKLKELISKIEETDNLKRNTLIDKINIDKETTYKLYSLPLNNMFRIFFGNIFPKFENQYVIFEGNFMVIGNSKNAISEFIHSNILHKTLDNDIKFEQFTDYLSSKSNFYFYTNLFRSPDFISEFLNPNLKKGFKNNVETFQKFQALAIQFQQNSDMIYNNIYLQYIPETIEEPLTVWESHLDTSINFKPAFVINHYTNENEIFVQDLNNKIYLINNVGRILWKLQLDEKINSEIYQADYYKNGKLQYLFSTKTKIHLIDRNGNYVERYPVKLQSPSTAGMAMFDYDKTMEYRIFIPCKNKNVYLYNIEGNLINGWKFGQTDTYVTKPVQYFRIGNKDYLVFADKYRVYILNRRGEERVRLKSQFPKSEKNIFMLESGNPNTEPRFVTTDTTSLVRFIYLDGTVESTQIKKYSPLHYFDYEDINADGFRDYIFLDKDRLEVFKKDGSELFDYKFDENIDLSPVYYYFSYEDRKIGVVSRKTNELFLFNSNGKLYKGFPLKGNTQFTIGYIGDSRNHFNLIVGNRYNFLYNYSVN